MQLLETTIRDHHVGCTERRFDELLTADGCANNVLSVCGRRKHHLSGTTVKAAHPEMFAGS